MNKLSPDNQALQNLISSLHPIAKALDLKVTTSIVVPETADQWPVVVGDMRMFYAIQEQGLERLGFTDPHLRRGITLTIGYNHEGLLDYQLVLSPLFFENEDTTGASAVESLIRAVELTVEESYVDFHADGRITGKGLGHFIAKTLRKSMPGDEVYDLLHNPDVEKPVRLILEGSAWSWLPKIEPDVTLH